MKEINKKKYYRFSVFSNLYYFMLLSVKWIFTRRKDLRYYAMERLANMFNPGFRFTEFGQVWREDKKFEEYYAHFGGNNYHSLDRKYTLNQFLQLTGNVEGDTAECGAYEGATSYLICAFIREHEQIKTHHIFDSFEGLSQPQKEDGAYWKKGNLSASEENCRNNLSAFGFVEYYKGWIPDKFPEVKDLRFSFVHIDVDLYQPTLDSVEFFYERLNKGAVIICDDYGFSTCPGAKKAMDDFFATRPEKLIMLTTGQSFMIKE